MIIGLSVMRVVRGVPLWVVCVGVCCAPSCDYEYRVLGCLYSSMGLVMALYVASIASFCSPHVVDVSALIICNVLRAFVVFSM